MEGLQTYGKGSRLCGLQRGTKRSNKEVRKSKRYVELKLAQHIKSDNKSLYAYVRSKQNVRDKVGPLEDNAGE